MSFLLSPPANQPQKVEQSYFAELDPRLTTLKNADRIDEIVSSLVFQRQETFAAGPIARTTRRDWNIVSAKMFVFSRNANYRALIEADLAEFQYQVSELYKMASIGTFNDVDTSWLQKITLDLKIVSPMSASWLRAMKVWDTCTARLLSAEREGTLDKPMKRRMMHPVVISYIGFKRRAMKSKSLSMLDMMVDDELL